VRAVARGDDIAASPDGRSVYIASGEDNGHGLAILRRDPTTGQLTQPAGTAGCIQRIGANGCATAPTTSFAPTRVVVSGDGTSVYVISWGDLFSFVRSPTTGLLTAGPCYQHAPQPPCMALPLLAYATDILVSDDGRNVYLLGGLSSDSYTDAIAAFRRQNAESPLVLLPQPGGCLIPVGAAANCRTSQALTGEDDDEPQYGSPHQLTTSADGQTIYLDRTHGNGAEIVTFARNTQTGTLRQSGTLKIGTLHAGVTDSTTFLSPDDQSLYATEEANPFSYGGDVIRLFRARP
jgi:DNA-binding beta-propeller fold protein YncE